jgi:hypothetical protein
LTAEVGEVFSARPERSLGRTSLDKREFLLVARWDDRTVAHMADAGVIGDLKPLFENTCGRTGEEEGVSGDMAVEEVESTLDEGTLVDLPTQPGTLSATTRPSYSKPEVPCTMGRPSPLGMGFHGSANCGFKEGDPIFDDDTEAPDSDEAESTGGCSKECDAEFGDP